MVDLSIGPSESSEDEDGEVEEDEFEDDIVYLRSLDPKVIFRTILISSEATL